MKSLQQGLNDLFGRPRAKRLPDQDAKPRRAFKALGLPYTKAHDGYVEIAPCEAFPDGLVTYHYDWSETLRRVEACLADSTLIINGGYSE